MYQMSEKQQELKLVCLYVYVKPPGGASRDSCTALYAACGGGVDAYPALTSELDERPEFIGGPEDRRLTLDSSVAIFASFIART